MELLTLHASMFINIGIWGGVASTSNAFNEERWPEVRGAINVATALTRVQLDQIGLDVAVAQADRILAKLSDPAATAHDTIPLMKELLSRVSDHLKKRDLLIIPASQSRYYDSPLQGWEKCCDRFPRIIDHVEESSRCLALGRNTACVYHLAGIVQEALESLGKNLGISLNPYTDTWNGLISKIEISMKAKSASSPSKNGWKALEPFYSELVSDLRAMKNAWRNPTMHFRRTYTDTQAQKAYRHVQDFMEHASTRLRGRKS